MKTLQSLAGLRRGLFALAGIFAANPVTAQTSSATSATRYLVIGYMKPAPGKTSDYVRLEREKWKLIHQDNVDKGRLTSWKLYAVSWPNGDEQEYDYVTIMEYPSFAHLDGGYIAANVAKVLGGENKMAELRTATGAVRQLRRNDTLTLLLATDGWSNAANRVLSVHYLRSLPGKAADLMNIQRDYFLPSNNDLILVEARRWSGQVSEGGIAGENDGSASPEMPPGVNVRRGRGLGRSRRGKGCNASAAWNPFAAGPGFAGTVRRMKFVSWNVNGVRAAHKKGLLDFMEKARADVICLQEAKCHPGDVQHIAWPHGYEVFWNPAVKKGYSGTVMFTRLKPKEVSLGIGMKGHDDEGRVITAEYGDFFLLNVYQPNSQRGLTRLKYRVEKWDPAFLAYLKKLEKRGKPVIFCGDLNVAHTEIDLTNPKTNRRNAGFTDEERANFTNLLESGFMDTFREFEKGPGHYTWWSQMMNCRARNIGWRVDYFVASRKLRPALKRAWINPEVTGSDHCPVGLEIG